MLAQSSRRIFKQYQTDSPETKKLMLQKNYLTHYMRLSKMFSPVFHISQFTVHSGAGRVAYIPKVLGMRLL